MTRARLLLAVAAVVGAASMPAAARADGGLDRIDVASIQPAFDGVTFGGVGAYELVAGTAYGRVDPDEPANADLAYLDQAPRDADGMVAYSMDFRMLRPADPRRGNGKIFYDVINRGGNPTSFGNLNEGSLTDPGNGFLMKQGYEIVWSGWQPDAEPSTAIYKPNFPIARGPGGAPIVKRTMHQLIPDTPMSGAGDTQTVVGNLLAANLVYAPAANPRVTLTVRQEQDDPPTPLSPSAVSFPGGKRVQVDMSEAIAKGFDQGAIYEIDYDARDPWVGGLGFVSIRDLVSHLRHESALPGKPVKAAYAWGVSQDGRFLKDFIWQGFNADLDGRRVFDGVIPLVSGGKKTDHNLPEPSDPFPQTSRWVRQHEEHEYPGSEFPFTYGTLQDPLSGRTDGILRACSVTVTCPKVFHIDSDFETWNGHMSLVTTDTLGRALSLPSNVRAFMISGQQHGPGNGIPRPLATCKLQSDPVDGKPVFRALVVAMDRWVTRGVRPPDSHFPNLRDGTLQTLERAAAAWPSIPGFPFNPRIYVSRVGDFSLTPPVFGAAYPIYVPTTDRYGNPEGGVITPDLAAPLGTYSGRNFRRPGHAEDELCAGNGGFIPFAAAAADKPAGDSRPALDELYPGGAAQFRAQRLRGALRLATAGLLLPSEIRSYADEVRFP
jgi:hypothetical protein